MPTPNCTRTLPEGYREILSIDLQKDPKTALLVNGLTLIPTVILALIGFGFAYWDYQQNTELKGSVAVAADTDGGEEDGI